ncbi:MAG TPA: gephyrin-like molybdotransferase Glp [Candidatus Aquilonibacter sp.]|nr:gephyrin-like molybdotransferase Glp [Candidatus Aquilonibacter sp.]
MLSVEAARAKVVEILTARAQPLESEPIDFSRDPGRALGRVLAEKIVADRNYPPFDRSIRDGFALRAQDAAQSGARLRIIGESRAGFAFEGCVGAGECVRIFTGAPIPRGTNAVVMQEFARVEDGFAVVDKPALPSQNYVLAGAESRVGEVVIAPGTRLSFAEIAMAAQVGRPSVEVSRRPRVAILTTGDEIVAVDAKPGPFQIRNSNSVSLGVLVQIAGGHPVICENAPDDMARLRIQIERALESDVLVLSGGVSVGQYDFVEEVLRGLGAEFFFDSVALRPGKPAVFGWCKGRPVFGLPGNPVSTMVTFELFVRPAIEFLTGRPARPIPYLKARLAHPITERGNLTHYLPARITQRNGDPVVETLLWEGSGDIGAVVRGNCFLVVQPDRLDLEEGDWVDVLPRRGAM